MGSPSCDHVNSFHLITGRSAVTTTGLSFPQHRSSFLFSLLPLGQNHETYLPAKCSSPLDETRLPRSHVYQSRPRYLKEPPPQGKGKAVRLITRISDRTTHQRFRTDAIRIRHDWLGISYLPPAQPGHYRVAYALTRGAGSAVTRNRLRRQLAPLLETRGADNNLLPGDYLMKIRRPVSASTDEIAVVLDRALAKLAARLDSAS